MKFLFLEETNEVPSCSSSSQKEQIKFFLAHSLRRRNKQKSVYCEKIVFFNLVIGFFTNVTHIK